MLSKQKSTICTKNSKVLFARCLLFHIIVQSWSKIDALYILPSSHITSILSKPPAHTRLTNKKPSNQKTQKSSRHRRAFLDNKQNQTTIIIKAKRSTLLYKNQRIFITLNHGRIQQVNQTRSSRSERRRFTTPARLRNRPSIS
jgi:hypothetical protein